MDELKASLDVKGSKDSGQAAYTAQRTRHPTTDWVLDSVSVVTAAERISILEPSPVDPQDTIISTDKQESYWQDAVFAVCTIM